MILQRIVSRGWRQLLLPMACIGLVACTGAGRPLVANPTPREPAEIVVADNMERITDHALALATRYGADQVLVVYDIDSTLLYDPRGGPDIKDLRIDNPQRSWPMDRVIMYLKSLAATESGLPDQLNRLQQVGVATYALTARGNDMRDMTLRELAANDIAFPLAPECGPPLCERRGEIDAEHVYQTALKLMGAAELARVGFERGRSISVSDGVVMASGLDKGVLLRALLESLERDFGAVVFVDDLEKNVVNVARVSPNMREEVAIYHYRGPLRPRALSKAEANARWQQVVDAICYAFNSRWCAEP
mgnify:CR=1 FL=1